MDWFKKWVLKPLVGMWWTLYFGLGLVVSAWGGWNNLTTLSEYSGWTAFGRGVVGISGIFLALAVLYISGLTVSFVHLTGNEEEDSE